MTKKEYFEFSEKFFAACVELSRRKNNDYTSGSDNAFANFQAVEQFGAATTEQGFMTRIIDKIMRLSTFVKDGQLQVKDESVTDTLRDLANYSALFAGYLESKKKKAIGLENVSNGDSQNRPAGNAFRNPLTMTEPKY
jgi:hypothetical protein